MTMPLNFDGQQWSNAADDAVQLVEPDPSWPAQFAAEARAIAAALRPLEPRLEHFGSTAVPDLPAKPIIDLLIILDDLPAWPQLIAPLAGLGYVYWAGNPRPDRMFFVKGMPPYGPRRSHHAHVRISADTTAELAFRDWLRAHPAEATQYAKLKRELVERFGSDREAYTAAKSGFIQEILAKAANDGRRAA